MADDGAAQHLEVERRQLLVVYPSECAGQDPTPGWLQRVAGGGRLRTTEQVRLCD